MMLDWVGELAALAVSKSSSLGIVVGSARLSCLDHPGFVKMGSPGLKTGGLRARLSCLCSPGEVTVSAISSKVVAHKLGVAV